MTSDKEHLKSTFRSKMHCEISSIINSAEYTSCNAQNPRTLAKDRFFVFIKKCAIATGDNEIIAKDNLIKLISDCFSDGEIKSILGPIFNKKGN